MNDSNHVMRNLVEMGKEHGFLTLEQISRSLSSTRMKSEQVDELMRTLDELGIEVVDRKKPQAAPTSGRER